MTRLSTRETSCEYNFSQRLFKTFFVWIMEHAESKILNVKQQILTQLLQCTVYIKIYDAGYLISWNNIIKLLYNTCIQLMRKRAHHLILDKTFQMVTAHGTWPPGRNCCTFQLATFVACHTLLFPCVLSAFSLSLSNKFKKCSKNK